MKLRTKYILFVVIIHLVTLTLSFIILKDNTFFFILSEILIVCSIIIAWQLYNQLLQPLQTILRGLEAIKERDFNIKFVTTGKYEMDQLISVYNEMMDQLKLERTKQVEQHFFLSKIIDTSPTGIIILDYDGRIQQLNPAAQRFFPYAGDVTGTLPGDLPDAVMQEIQKLKSGASKTVTLNGTTTYKLQKSHFIDRGFARYFVMVEELTTELIAAEKKAYGKVIRMMAHEVNNTIGPVNSIIDSALKNKAFAGNGAYGELQEAFEVARQRNQALNIFMRNFADVVRLPEPSKAALDLNKLVEQVTTLMTAKAMERNIIFQNAFSPGEIIIRADEQQLALVLINAIKNAMESIEGNGIIGISTSAVPLKLVITDNGKGIDPSVAEEIFTPFFSTKKTGQGIGLTVMKDILMNHGFSFSLKTVAPGKTQFEIMFG